MMGHACTGSHYVRAAISRDIQKGVERRGCAVSNALQGLYSMLHVYRGGNKAMC